MVFTYSRPVVTSATSASGVSTAGGSVFTVSGSNFGPFSSPMVALGGVAQTLISFTDSQIVVNSTAGMFCVSWPSVLISCTVSSPHSLTIHCLVSQVKALPP
jgi:hypothetical protein